MISNLLMEFNRFINSKFSNLEILGLLLYILSTTILMISNFSILSLGGILLIIGSYLTYKGYIFLSVFIFIFADICWTSNAVQNGDIQGFIFVSIGTLLGIFGMVKMNNGTMNKNLNKEKGSNV